MIIYMIVIIQKQPNLQPEISLYRPTGWAQTALSQTTGGKAVASKGDILAQGKCIDDQYIDIDDVFDGIPLFKSDFPFVTDQNDLDRKRELHTWRPIELGQPCTNWVCY